MNVLFQFSDDEGYSRPAPAFCFHSNSKQLGGWIRFEEKGMQKQVKLVKQLHNTFKYFNIKWHDLKRSKTLNLNKVS